MFQMDPNTLSQLQSITLLSKLLTQKYNLQDLILYKSKDFVQWHQNQRTKQLMLTLWHKTVTTTTTHDPTSLKIFSFSAKPKL